MALQEVKTFEQALQIKFGYPPSVMPQILEIIVIEAEAAAGARGVIKYGLIPDALMRNSPGWIEKTRQEETLARQICAIKGISEEEWVKQGGPKLLIDNHINPLYELPFENTQVGERIAGIIGEINEYLDHNRRSR